MRRAIVVMGVSGSGKSRVAAGLAAFFGLRCLDGDDLHAPEAVAKMRQGIALTDDDRWPWLDRVGAALAGANGNEGSNEGSGERGVVVACSALRRAYRDRLRRACPGLRFVFLDGAQALIEQRLRERQGHYMPASLLASQFEALERPGQDEGDVLSLHIHAPAEQVVREACAALESTGRSPAN